MQHLNRTIYISLIAVVVLGLLGCDNNLSENVYSSVTDQNYNYQDASYEGIIGAAYVPLRERVVGDQEHGNYMAQEMTADAIVMPGNLAGGWVDGGIYQRMHLHQWNAEQIHISNMWKGFYKGVINTNRIIDQIEQDKISIPSSIGKQTVIAEMRAMRAFYYWLILDNFGSAPLVKSASATQELPSKTSREKLYDFVVSEVTSVMSDLSESTGEDMYGRMNKWAAKSLLANVYLNAEVYIGETKWEQVIQQTNDIIDSGQYQLDDTYSDIFASQNQDSPEIIFSVPMDENLGGAFNIHKWAWHTVMSTKFQVQSTAWGTGSARGVPQFNATYDTLDSRLDETWLRGPQFGPNGEPLMGIFDEKGDQINFENKLRNAYRVSEDDGWRVVKFEVPQGARDQLNNDFPYFRYAEVLMMKAEALLRTNRASEAATIVTQVRQRAYKDNLSEAMVTGAELQQDSKYNYGYIEDFEIVDEGNTEPVQFGRFLDELGWEFSWEAHRRRDLIRFGVYTKKSWLSHRPNGDYRTVFPIPQNVIDTNPKVEQNPDYQ